MSLLLCGIAGCLLGAAYVGHLWRDVQRFVLTGRRSLRWGMLSRLTGVGAGFLLIGRTGGLNLTAALIGLLITRTVLVWRVGRMRDA